MEIHVLWGSQDAAVPNELCHRTKNQAATTARKVLITNLGIKNPPKLIGAKTCRDSTKGISFPDMSHYLRYDLLSMF